MRNLNSAIFFNIGFVFCFCPIEILYSQGQGDLGTECVNKYESPYLSPKQLFFVSFPFWSYDPYIPISRTMLISNEKCTARWFLNDTLFFDVNHVEFDSFYDAKLHIILRLNRLGLNSECYWVFPVAIREMGVDSLIYCNAEYNSSYYPLYLFWYSNDFGQIFYIFDIDEMKIYSFVHDFITMPLFLSLNLKHKYVVAVDLTGPSGFSALPLTEIACN